jgi:hypothetical protein
MKRSLNILDYSLIAAAVLLVAAGLFAFALKAKANPSVFASAAQSELATTTTTTITPGAATTTVVYDAFESAGTNQNFSGNMVLPSKLALNLQMRASSTATILTAAIEHSQDAIDWYQSNVYHSSGVQLFRPRRTRLTFRHRFRSAGSSPPQRSAATPDLVVTA